MFTAVFSSSDSEEETSSTESGFVRKKTCCISLVTLEDAAIQAFYLIGLIAKHCEIEFQVLHPSNLTAAIPQLQKIKTEDNIIDFDYSSKKNIHDLRQLIIETNKVLIDFATSLNYTILLLGTESDTSFETISDIEYQMSNIATNEDIAEVGTVLHNEFYSQHSITLNPSSSVIQEYYFPPSSEQSEETSLSLYE